MLSGSLRHMHDAALGVGEFSLQYQPGGTVVGSPPQPAAPKASTVTRSTFNTCCACEALKDALKRASNAHFSALRGSLFIVETRQEVGPTTCAPMSNPVSCKLLTFVKGAGSTAPRRESPTAATRMSARYSYRSA